MTQTNIMKQGPSLKRKSRSARKEIPMTLWNRNGHYNLQNNETLVLTLSHINLVQITLY